MARTKKAEGNRKARTANLNLQYNPANDLNLTPQERRVARKEKRKTKFEEIYQRYHIQDGNVIMMLAIATDSVRKDGTHIGAYGAVPYTCNAKSVQGSHEGPLAGTHNFDLIGAKNILEQCADGEQITIVTRHQVLFNFLNDLPADKVNKKYADIIVPLKHSIKEIIRSKNLLVNSKMLDTTNRNYKKVFAAANKLANKEKTARVGEYNKRKLAANQHGPLMSGYATGNERKETREVEEREETVMVTKSEYNRMLQQQLWYQKNQSASSSSPFHIPSTSITPPVLQRNQVQCSPHQQQQHQVAQSITGPSQTSSNARAVMTRDPRLVHTQSLEPQQPLPVASWSSSSSIMAEYSNIVSDSHMRPVDGEIARKLMNRLGHCLPQQEQQYRVQQQHGFHVVDGRGNAVGTSSKMPPRVFNAVGDNVIGNEGKDADQYGSNSSGINSSGRDDYVGTGNSNAGLDDEEMFIDAVDNSDNHCGSSSNAIQESTHQQQGTISSLKQWVTGALQRFGNV